MGARSQSCKKAHLRRIVVADTNREDIAPVAGSTGNEGWWRRELHVRTPRAEIAEIFKAEDFPAEMGEVYRDALRTGRPRCKADTHRYVFQFGPSREVSRYPVGSIAFVLPL